MLDELRARGFRVGKTRVERLMREHDIRARHKRRFQATTDSKHDLPVAANVLERNFSPEAPNRVWSADLTYSTPSQRSPPVLGVELLEHVWNACSVKLMLR
jgi:transposase InsO family protein